MSEKHIILVTGLAGSGTSRVAEHLHRSGLPMLVSMAAPPPGSPIYLDWEDFLWVAWCGIPALREGMPGKVWEYVGSRFQRGRVWGVKSPLLLPHLDVWRDAAKRSYAKLTVILTERRFDECQDSIRRWGHIHPEERDRLLAWNEKHCTDWQTESARADYRVPFNWTEFPITEVKTWLMPQR